MLLLYVNSIVNIYESKVTELCCDVTGHKLKQCCLGRQHCFNFWPVTSYFSQTLAFFARRTFREFQRIMWQYTNFDWLRGQHYTYIDQRDQCCPRPRSGRGQHPDPEGKYSYNVDRGDSPNLFCHIMRWNSINVILSHNMFHSTNKQRWCAINWKHCPFSHWIRPTRRCFRAQTALTKIVYLH